MERSELIKLGGNIKGIRKENRKENKRWMEKKNIEEI
jgi:hypothetical protein